jgi:hypothetical protein
MNLKKISSSGFTDNWLSKSRYPYSLFVIGGKFSDTFPIVFRNSSSNRVCGSFFFKITDFKQKQIQY